MRFSAQIRPLPSAIGRASDWDSARPDRNPRCCSVAVVLVDSDRDANLPDQPQQRASPRRCGVPTPARILSARRPVIHVGFVRVSLQPLLLVLLCSEQRRSFEPRERARPSLRMRRPIRIRELANAEFVVIPRRRSYWIEEIRDGDERRVIARYPSEDDAAPAIAIFEKNNESESTGRWLWNVQASNIGTGLESRGMPAAARRSPACFVAAVGRADAFGPGG